jgi:hypothetical protein
VNISQHIKVDKATFFRFIAAQAEGRYEYDRGRVVQQMTGGTLAHSLVSQHFITAFERRLDANAWAVTGQSRGVETPVTVRYSDVLAEPMSGAVKGLATEVPAVVAEVLSPTTEEMDLNVKLSEHTGIASLEAYTLQARMRLAAGCGFGNRTGASASDRTKSQDWKVSSTCPHSHCRFL